MQQRCWLNWSTRQMLWTQASWTFAARSFVLYDFKDGPPVVLVEAQTADLYVSAEADVLSYRRLFKELEKDSLDADASRNLIEEARRRLAS
jgi:hypothetical protein